MSKDILYQIIQELEETHTGLSSIELDETNDVTNFAQLLAYAFYYENDKKKRISCFVSPCKRQLLILILFIQLMISSKNIRFNGRNYAEFILTGHS